MSSPWMAESRLISIPTSSIEAAESSQTLLAFPAQQPSLEAPPLEWELQDILTSYYFHCHPSHPFLPPRPLLGRLLQDKTLPFLQSAIRYTTASFIPRDTSHRFISDSIISEVLAIYDNREYEVSDAPYLLQALLLLALASGTQANGERALSLMITFRKFAIELGLNRSQFALLHGEGNPLLEDSWRRTWWEANAIDAMRYGMHAWEAPLGQVEADVLVPMGSWEGKGVCIHSLFC
jgi:hypothetical protein